MSLLRTTDLLARRKVTANLFGIPFGLCGLAQCWTTAAAAGHSPEWPASVAWSLAAAAWVVVATGYGMQLGHGRTLRSEVADPVFGPFLAAGTITVMLLGGALAQTAPTVGRGVFVIALIATTGLGGWLSGELIVSETTLARWHPGYLLPTVAGGLVGAAVSASLGYRTLAELLFGSGLLSWLTWGMIPLLRLLTQPPLPPGLTSTMAIVMAPPAVAGTAWFQINGGRADEVALALAGYAILMTLVQLRLAPVLRAVPFGPTWWAFAFSYTATLGYAMRWVGVAPVSHRGVWTWALLVLATCAQAALLARSAHALATGRFLPES